MFAKYEEIFDKYKEFVENNSKYETVVVKYNNNTSSHFPIVNCVLSDNKDTDYCSNEKIEYYEAFYFTIDIYAKDKEIKTIKIINDVEVEDYETVASQVIIDELTKLTIQFFGGLNMKRTLNRPTPNLDTSVLRKTIQYQSLIGTRGNIIRR